MDQPRWENYSSCCRLCLDDKLGSLRSIFEDIVRGSLLVQQIRTFIGIEVKAGDKLSTMICEQCLSKVHMWNTFTKSCSENQDKLTGWMKCWELNNIPSMEVQIKHEADDESYEITSMEEDTYDDPPPLTPQLPDDTFVENMEDDPLKENETSLENDISQNEILENEIYHNEKKHTTVNGVVISDANSTACAFCYKIFSNPYNRRRHETDVHRRKSSLPPKEDPLAITPKSTNIEVDAQKIQFAAGLQLKQRSAQPANLESSFTKVEVAYLEKFKNIIGMVDSLICACHNDKFNELKDLFSHLKNLRTWFAMFTCYNCLITYYDRPSYMSHYCKCVKALLLNTRRLSEFSKNSEVKIRIYQNFKCLKCRLIYALYEDFCGHLDDNHMEIEQDSSPYTCLCSESFDDAEELNQHMNVSCFIIYYCDACYTCYSTIDEFREHCEKEHDNMDGDSLNKYDYYRKSNIRAGESISAVKEGERRISTRRQTLNERKSSILEAEDEKKYTPKSKKVVNSHSLKNLKISKPTSCPECNKMYSSYHNMLRHYTLMHDETGLILTCQFCPEKFRLISELKEHEGTVHEEIVSPNEKTTNNIPKFSCPDCKEMFNTAEEWKKHIELYPKKTCEECGKQFNLQSDLEQHRSVHLNIKVYRDSKTQNYKSTMLSPALSCTVCDVTFSTKKELLQHKSLHDKMPELTIQDESLLDEKKEDSKKYSCSPCNKNYLSYAGIYDHLKTHHPDQETIKEFPKQCPHCDKVLLTRGAYGNHKRMHDRLLGLLPKTEEETPKQKVPKVLSDDSESYYTCKRCFKVFSSKYNLKNHMKSHGINLNNSRSSVKTGKVLKTYWCDICHQACIGYAELQEHKQEHRQEKLKVTNIVSEPDLPQQINPFIFNCDICSASFSTNFALKRHREKHDQDVNKQNNAVVYCKYCKIPFASTAQWNEHMSNEHAEISCENKESQLVSKTYACKICKKAFDNSGALASHQGWHKRGKVAKKVFNNTKIKTELPVLVPKVEVNSYQCTNCALQFINETALQIHILETHRNITRVLSLSCSSCCTSFESKSAYDTHMELHKVVQNQRATAKPFICQFCPARFSRKDRLRGHIRVHHGDQVEPTETFNCTQCSRTFDKQTALITHLKVHERHRLSGMSTQLSKGSSISASNKNVYSCSICNVGFSLSKDLRTHVITVHPF